VLLACFLVTPEARMSHSPAGEVPGPKTSRRFRAWRSQTQFGGNLSREVPIEMAVARSVRIEGLPATDAPEHPILPAIHFDETSTVREEYRPHVLHLSELERVGFEPAGKRDPASTAQEFRGFMLLEHLNLVSNNLAALVELALHRHC
jgi:hypothetical protein